MKSFLEEIAERLIRDYGSGTGKVSLVFPNKRAGLFFIRELSTKVTRPLWSPMIFSLEEFIYALSGRQPADRLTLILSLYQAYSRACGIEETFDRFFFWGDILLNDFDETDQYLVNPDQVFSSVRDLKEIDAEFPFLTGEQKDIIREFWGRLSGKDSDFKEGFLKFWRSLPAIYRSFHEILNRKGYFYRGLIYRDLTKQVTDGQFKWEGGPVIFAGFNALTAAEETIIRWFVGNGIGTLVWDTDSFYLNNPLHEAGLFQRRYLHDGDFGGTFPRPVPANIRNNSLEVETVATSSDTAQARWAGDKILELHRQGLMNRPEKTVIVMPDETMVIPLLYALPAEADRINITIAYPVRSAPLYSFFEWVLELHENRRDSSVGTWFNHAQVLPLLSHPVIRSSSGEKAGDLAQKIRQENKIYIPASYLTQGDGSLLDEVFKRVKDDAGIPEYLTGLILSMRNAGSANAYDDEIHYFFYRLFRRLKETFTAGEVPVSFAMLKKLFRQLSRSERVSFSGEPLEGLQIMGIMETRNLDFDHVILLNANEGIFPRQAFHNSFIPYNVRKAFRLPNFEHTGSIYSYLFYRLLQRTRKMWLIYNTEESGNISGEPSRYIQQLRYESVLPVKEKVLVQRLRTEPVPPLVISKSPDIIQSLACYLAGDVKEDKFLTPTALNTYLDCPLSFYYKYVLGVREREEVSPDFNALLFGNILHKAMEIIYGEIAESGGGLITAGSIENQQSKIDTAVGKCFAMQFGIGRAEDFRFEGRNVLGREIITRMIRRIMEIDAAYAPFTIQGLEKRMISRVTVSGNGKSFTVNIRGIIDRIDSRNGKVRIVDYKSGRDFRQFNSVEALFGEEEDKRNKAVFQTLFYSMALAEAEKMDRPAIPCLYNSREIYLEDFDPMLRMGPDKDPVIPDQSILKEQILPEFRKRLEGLLLEIFDPAVPFRHREEGRECPFCQRAGFPT